jgi:hypothetical protein
MMDTDGYFNDEVVRAAELLGVSLGDIKKYAGKNLSLEAAKLGREILDVAELMGNSVEDLLRYGYR